MEYVRAGLTRRRLLGGIAGGGALLLGTVAVTADPPQVVSVKSEFGDVRERWAEIDTEIVIENPNGWPIPGSHTIEYAVTLNGVAVAHGQKRGIRIGTAQTVINTTAQFDNTAIPDWWTTHVNSAESTTMRTQSWVNLAGLGIGLSLPPEETDITTDFLGALGEGEATTVLLGDREVLIVGDQRADWGTATGDRSPLKFTTEVENIHERPVGIDGTDYEVVMNDVVVGAGETSDAIHLDPGETGTVTVEAAIDTPKMQRWWVSHLRNDHSTELTIAVFAVSIDDSGERTRLPFSILHQRSTFETDMLGTGETLVTPIEADPSEEFAEPTVLETASERGEVHEAETDIETVVKLRSDNDEALSELLSLDIEQETTIAGSTVARGSDRVDRLPQGEGQIEFLSTKSHRAVPEWWAAHLGDGERSVSRTVVTGDADVSVTTIPLALEDREHRRDGLARRPKR